MAGTNVFSPAMRNCAIGRFPVHGSDATASHGRRPLGARLVPAGTGCFFNYLQHAFVVARARFTGRRMNNLPRTTHAARTPGCPRKRDSITLRDRATAMEGTHDGIRPQPDGRDDDGPDVALSRRDLYRSEGRHATRIAAGE